MTRSQGSQALSQRLMRGGGLLDHQRRCYGGTSYSRAERLIEFNRNCDVIERVMQIAKAVIKKEKKKKSDLLLTGNQ